MWDGLYIGRDCIGRGYIYGEQLLWESLYSGDLVIRRACIGRADIWRAYIGGSLREGELIYWES